MSFARVPARGALYEVAVAQWELAPVPGRDSVTPVTTTYHAGPVRVGAVKGPNTRASIIS